jgi:16S rRNA (guanine527-N7)-methyltransferase
VKHDSDGSSVLQRQVSSLGMSVSSGQAAAILDFESAIRDRGRRAGVVSARDIPRLRERHILDCLRAAAVVGPGDRDAYDLGSGGGLPGIPIAIARPALHLRLVERRERRAALLEWLIEHLDIDNAEVLPGPIEGLSRPADLCFARALAPAATSWRLAEPLLRPAGRLVYFARRGGARIGHVPRTRTQVVRSESPLLEQAGPLVIMARE